VGAHPLRRLGGGFYYIVLAVAFLTVLGALGGASRGDELQQFFVRSAAILVIAAALWPLNFAAFRDARAPLIGTALIYLLLVIQLVPLPPGLWASMPGHHIYLPVAEQTHTVVWRPWTVSPDLTLNALAALLPATAAGLTALALDFRGRLLLARWVVGIACVSAALGLLQLASGGTSLHLFRTTSENSAVGLFANRNHQAVLMACCLPILAAVSSVRSRENAGFRRHLTLSIAVAALLLMGLAATGSRMGLLLGLVGLTAGAMIHFATSPRSTGRTRSVRPWLGGLALVALAIVPVSILIARNGAIQRLANDPIDQTRSAALHPMLDAVRAFMPFGAGFGTFQPVYEHFEPDSLLSTIYLNQAHNEPVQLAIEGGVAAMLLLLLFVLWWVRAASRTVRPWQSGSRRALAMAMAAVTLILMLSSLVDYPLRTPLLSGLFAIACIELVRSKRSGGAAPAS
jgi:hypothetical protein